MGSTGTAIFLGLLLALALTLWGLFTKQQSFLLGVISGIVAALTALAAWYAYAESNSMPWTIGYSLVCLMAIASSIRQFAGLGHAKN